MKEIISKIKHYCAYEDRSTYEVKHKLYGYGVPKTDADKIIAQLIQESYLNEERFAKQFAGGKFRIKNWGRIKIKYALQQKMVSQYNIRTALESIDHEDYLKTLQKLADKKWQQLRSKDFIVKKASTQFYLLQKGYEKHLVKKAIDKADSQAVS